MLPYKALYKKMMDDLKDAGMWIEWSEQMCEKHPDEAKFLLESAKDRLEEDFPKTYEHFEKLCKEKHETNVCMDEVIYDHIMDWRNSMMLKIEKLVKK